MVEQTLVDISAGVVPGMTTLPHLHELSITGPTNTAGVSDTPSRRKVFACRPVSNDDEIACAKKILGALARQAYRRPVTPNDLEGLLSFYQPAATTTATSPEHSKPEFAPGFRRSSRIPNSCSDSSASPPASCPARIIASAIWNSPRGFRSSCGAALLTIN